MKRILALATFSIVLFESHATTFAQEKAHIKLRSKIVFSSNRSGAWRLWTIQPDGTDLTQLVACPDPDAQDVDPAFSPNGKRILFTSTRGGKVGVWLVAEDGQHAERVCDGDQADWSPDGKTIAFRNDGKIWTRNLQTGAEKQIVPSEFSICSGPAWSPDGKTIAFACRWDAGNGLFLVAANGGKPTKIYDKQGACEPHWSPDGRRLVYETETHICTISPDGTKNRLITYYGGVQRFGRFSPDGTQIVFCQGVTENGPWELYRVPSQGGPPTRLTEGGSDMSPDWH